MSAQPSNDTLAKTTDESATQTISVTIPTVATDDEKHLTSDQVDNFLNSFKSGAQNSEWETQNIVPYEEGDDDYQVTGDDSQTEITSLYHILKNQFARAFFDYAQALSKMKPDVPASTFYVPTLEENWRFRGNPTALGEHLALKYYPVEKTFHPDLLYHLFRGITNFISKNDTISMTTKEKFKEVFHWLVQSTADKVTPSEHTSKIYDSVHDDDAQISKYDLRFYTKKVCIIESLRVVLALPNNNMWLVKLILKHDFGLTMDDIKDNLSYNVTIQNLLEKHLEDSIKEKEESVVEDASPKKIESEDKHLDKIETGEEISTNEIQVKVLGCSMNIKLEAGFTLKISHQDG